MHDHGIATGYRRRRLPTGRRCRVQPDNAWRADARRAPQQAVPGRPHLHRALAEPSVGRGPDGPVDARRQPDQVASGAHDLVLRDVRAAAARARLPRRSIRPTSTSSIPITRPSARAIRGRSAACSRGPASTRSWPIARMSTTRWQRCSTAPADGHATALVELGLHHEQQHQELILTDIKHCCRCNPLKPAYRAAATPCRTTRRRHRRGVDFEGGLVEIGHDGEGSLSTTKGRATASGSSRSRSPRGR